MDRRNFLRGLATAGAATAFGGGFIQRVLADPATAGTSPWGEPTQTFDFGDHAVTVPAGFDFDVRVIAESGQPVPGTSYPWHIFPDGAATFPTGDGGWILVSNSEAPLAPATGFSGIPNPGGAGAIRFDSAGQVVDAYSILTGTKVNCAGGPTPWGTWLSCEEWDGGYVWECDPTGAATARRLDALGRFQHEAAVIDGTGIVYLTEDQGDGLFYRFTPAGPGPDGLASGVLEAMVVADLPAVLAGGVSGVSWVEIPNPNPDAYDYQEYWLTRTPVPYPETPVRHQVGATPFDGGEGCWFHDGLIHFTTKGDDRVWQLRVADQTLTLIHDPDASGSTLTGVDNIVAHSATGDLYVAQDQYDLKIQVITMDATGHPGVVAPIALFTGDGHYRPPVVPPPADTFNQSEITGPAFDPSGSRLYCSSQRYHGLGVTYEISGPFASS